MSSEPASPHEYGDDISTSSLSSSEDEGSGGYVCSQSDQSEDISSDDSIEESPRPRAKKRKTGSGGKKASRNTKKKNSAATRKPSASLTLSRKARRRIPTSSPDFECSDTQDGSGTSSPPRTLQLAPRSSRVTGHNASVPPARAPHLSTPSAPTRRGDSSRMPPAGSPDSVVQLISTHVDLHALSENSQARSSISGADQNNAADEGASTSTRLATPATMPSSSFPASCTYACIQHCPATSSVTSITTPRAHVAPSEAEPEVPWSLVKSRFPWTDTDPQTGRMVLEAGASTFDPSDLFLLVDPACAIRPAKWQYLVDVYTGEVEAEHGESCVDRYVMAFRDRTVWTLAWGAWISAVMMSHPYPRPVILALSQVMEWCLELRGAKRWSSIMRFMFHQHRALLEEDGEVIGRRWDPHDWYTSPLYALHLGSAANRGHCTPHVLQHGHERSGDEDTASEDEEEAEPCRIWNVRSNGCSYAAHGEDTAARHVCLMCRGQHRVVDREDCRQEALERRFD